MPDPNLVATARQAADAYGIPSELFLAQINAESSFNPNPGSPSYVAPDGSSPAGIAQFIGSTASAYGVTNRMDPVQSLWGAAAYDTALYKQKGSWAGVLAGYGTTSGDALKTNPAAVTAQNIAQAADTGQSIMPGASGVNDSGGTAATNPLPNAPPPVNTLGGALQGVSGALGAFTGGFLKVFIAIAVVLIGLILIWNGLAGLRGTTITDDVGKLKKAAA